MTLFAKKKKEKLQSQKSIRIPHAMIPFSQKDVNDKELKWYASGR